jgi:hypothetical protein
MAAWLKNSQKHKGHKRLVVFRLGAASHRSVREEEVHEIFREDVGGRSSERIRTVHRHLIIDTDRNDIARGNGLEVDLVVGRHHAEAF